jgi:hypothetical protein
MTQEPEPRRRRGIRNWPRRNLIAFGVVGGVALFVAFGHFLTWLWAVTVSDIFGWKEISFWQAWGLVLLSQILLKANFTSSTSRSARRPRSSDAPVA